MKTKHFHQLVAGFFALGVLALAGVPAPARAADAPGAGLPVNAGSGLRFCISLDKMDASRDGELKYWNKAAKEYGVKLLIQVAGEDAQRQSSQVDTCIAQRVNGILSIPWDDQAVLQDIARAHAAGIPFITMDQPPADTSTVDLHVGANPYQDGMRAGQYLVKLVGNKPTSVLDLQGDLSAANGINRDRGFKAGIKGHPNIVIVSQVLTLWHPEPALTGTENALQAHPDLGAIFAATDGFLPPIWAAEQKVNRYVKDGQPGHIIIMTVDGDPQGCAAIRDSRADVGYAQAFQAMAYTTMQAMINLVKYHKKPAQQVLWIPSVEYTPANFAETSPRVWGCQK
jgi:ABC-type sugar transport system substrate-binding protein